MQRHRTVPSLVSARLRPTGPGLPLDPRRRGTHCAEVRRIPLELQEFLREFSAGPAQVRAAIAGLDPATLNRRPPREDWSIRDVVIHLADAELVRATRLRYLIAEDEPLVVPFDEERWKRRLHYLFRDVEAALALFELTVFTSAELLEQCDAAAFERDGARPDGSRLRVRDLLEAGVAHVKEHVGQIAAFRAGQVP